MTKDEMRQKAKATARGLTSEYRAAASEAITKRLLSSPLFASCRTLFCYVGTPSEPDTAPIIKAALDAGKTVCVPRCKESGVMDAVPIRSLADLTGKRCFGIPQPEETAAPADPAKIDLVIVPCLAAGTTGERLGHGAGYYDRFLSTCSGVPVCLCFEKMVLPDIPMTPNDVYMRHLVTEKNWYSV